jgi:hypothetical protein
MDHGGAEKLLGAITAIHRRWLTGKLSQEDALFEIGDLLEDASPAADRSETDEPRDAHGAGRGDATAKSG